MTNRIVLLITHCSIILLGAINELICQPRIIGPSWFRWHMTSVAHVPLYSFLFYPAVSLFYYLIASRILKERWCKILGIALAFIPAAIYEIRQASGCDPIDLFCLAIGALMAYYFMPTFIFESQETAN